MSSARSEIKPLEIRSETSVYLFIIVLLGIFYLGSAAFEFALRTTYIRSMPLDLIFQLDGIYRMSMGQKIYADFSAILGLFSYLIPLLFVHLTGDVVLSVNYASGLLLVLTFPVVAYLAVTRLPPLFGLALGIWIALAIAARMNFGDDATAVTMAMNYNRQGDAALALAVLMFRPPQNSSSTIALVDGLLYAVLTGFLVYTKITFGLVALIFAPVVICSQRHRLVVLSAFVVGFALFVLAVEYGYGTRFLWIYPVRMALASSGSLSTMITRGIHLLLDNLPELLVCTLVPAWFLWRERRLTLLMVLFFAMVAGASGALIAENGQRFLLFLPAILFFVAAPQAAWGGQVDRSPPAGSAHWSDGLAVAMVVVLTLESGPQLINLAYAGYRSITSTPMVANDGVLGRIVIESEGFEEPSDTKYRSVLDEQMSVLDAFKTGRYFRPAHPFDVLTMLEFRDYLTDGMRAAREDCDPASRILTFDVANPFPLLLGWPPGGTMLVIHPGRILSRQAHPSDAGMFRDINCVLVPKLPARFDARDFMFDVYGSYFSSRFNPAGETTLWRVFKRASQG